MQSVLRAFEGTGAPQGPATLHDDWRGTLNALRITALTCRTAARIGLLEACAMIAKQPDNRNACAEALLRCMSDAMDCKPVFFQPGTDELSFDEAWLTRCLIAASGGDNDSLNFLIRSRVPKMHQRHITFLIRGISDQYALI